MDVGIAGWAHTPFGRLDGHSMEDLIAEVAGAAIAHADIAPDAIDEVIVSNFNSGMNPQGFPASLPISSVPALRFKPAVRVENACASGSAAVHLGGRAIASGQSRAVLVIGVEKMTAASGEDIRKALISASHVATEAGPQDSFASHFGSIAQRYFADHGDQSRALAQIAAKNHANGVHNPLAHMRKDLGFDFCNTATNSNPYVAKPLKRTDCSLVSDGAAAIVLTSPEISDLSGPDIRFRAMTQVNDALPMAGRDMTRFQGCAIAWFRALDQAGITLDDLDFVETHDCFTVAELIQYEAMGLADIGKGATLLEEGVTHSEGRLPVNLSGGLKSKGHPIGATGVSMHVLAARQLAGDPAGLAASDPKLGGIFNMGGAAVANYCSILERCS